MFFVVFFYKKVTEENGGEGDEKTETVEEWLKNETRGEETEMGGWRRGRDEGGGGGGGGEVRDGAQSCHFTTGEMNDFLPLDTGP